MRHPSLCMYILNVEGRHCCCPPPGSWNSRTICMEEATALYSSVGWNCELVSNRNCSSVSASSSLNGMESINGRGGGPAALLALVILRGERSGRSPPLWSFSSSTTQQKMQMTRLLHKKAIVAQSLWHCSKREKNKHCWSDRWFASRCAHGRITVQPCGDLGYIQDLNLNTNSAPHFMDGLYY